MDQLFSQKIHFRRSCSHTERDASNWWRATLSQKSSVNKIVIYNRVDEVPERINGAKVNTLSNIFFLQNVIIRDELFVNFHFLQLSLTEILVNSKKIDLASSAQI